MGNDPVSKRVQYALIAHLVEKLSDRRAPGKKALQKLVHLIEELGRVDVGYRFSFYTYGPYSADLTADLDAVAGLQGISISYLESENSYQILSGKNASWVAERGNDFIKQHSAAIERVIEQFGGRLAKDLELVSTIVYLKRHAPELFSDNSKLIERVRALKPKYSEFQVGEALKEVESFSLKSGSTRH